MFSAINNSSCNIFENTYLHLRPIFTYFHVNQPEPEHILQINSIGFASGTARKNILSMYHIALNKLQTQSYVL